MDEKKKWKAKLVAIRSLECKTGNKHAVARVRSKHRLKPGARKNFLPETVRGILDFRPDSLTESQ